MVIWVKVLIVVGLLPLLILHFLASYLPNTVGCVKGVECGGSAPPLALHFLASSIPDAVTWRKVSIAAFSLPLRALATYLPHAVGRVKGVESSGRMLVLCCYFYYN
jgi:hypothetical protein